jgi:glyoxylase-like metal-dependent hydrolase (beta-lactamase superfamily II)/rhodanese-related sulfurtransferase
MEEMIITPEKLQEKLAKKEPVFILDVRPVMERKEWRIAESEHVDAYKRLNAGDFTILDDVQIPKNKTVITVCAAGRTSLIASEALRKKGVRAYSLQGGMKAWNYAWSTASIKLGNGVEVIQIRRAAKGILSYVVASANEAVVIDASLDPQVYMNLTKEKGWHIRYVTDTHIHADFISRTRELARASGAEHLLIDKATVDFEFTPIKQGASVAFGNAALEVLHTPGHTWESTTFRMEDTAVFTGDTLFVDGIGRPDLKAEQSEAVEKSKKLYQSLKRLFSLDRAALVLPAHTSGAIPFDNKLVADPIGNVSERVNITKMTELEFTEYVLAKIPPVPPNYLTIAAINRQGSHEGHKMDDLEAGGNHCAIN